jgi:hypothetical protein
MYRLLDVYDVNSAYDAFVLILLYDGMYLSIRAIVAQLLMLAQCTVSLDV